jgi:hypothetical protein
MFHLPADGLRDKAARSVSCSERPISRAERSLISAACAFITAAPDMCGSQMRPDIA